MQIYCFLKSFPLTVEDTNWHALGASECDQPMKENSLVTRLNIPIICRTDLNTCNTHHYH